jgi:DNA-binding GntR family transcriptional regulator
MEAMAKASQSAYSVIRSSIISGEFARGQRLREEQLASIVGVSRTPVREALRRLDAEGLVEFAPNRGARVTAWSGQELHELYEMRAMLEGYGARLAATRVSPEDLEELAALARRMETLSRRGASAADELTTANGQFHRALVTASGNVQLDTLVRSMMDVALITRTFQRYSPSRMRASAAQHTEIVEALRAGDAEWADAVMRTHILAARSTVLQSMAQDDELEDTED